MISRFSNEWEQNKGAGLNDKEYRSGCNSWHAASPRADEGVGLYHALNRGNGRDEMFHKSEDDAAFERIFAEGLETFVATFVCHQRMPNLGILSGLPMPMVISVGSCDGSPRRTRCVTGLTTTPLGKDMFTKGVFRASRFRLTPIF